MKTTMNMATMTMTALAVVLTGETLRDATGLPLPLALLIPVGAIALVFGLVTVMGGLFGRFRAPLSLEPRGGLTLAPATHPSRRARAAA